MWPIHEEINNNNKKPNNSPLYNLYVFHIQLVDYLHFWMTNTMTLKLTQRRAEAVRTENRYQSSAERVTGIRGFTAS